MNLHPDDGRLFYKLFSALLGYVNRKLDSFRAVSESETNTRRCRHRPGARSGMPCMHTGN